MTIKHHLVIVMGVSGTGKSTLAKRVANKLNWRFIDADDFHSAQAKLQMSEGTPLSDEQRLPWINRICDFLQNGGTQPTLLAYSGLRRAHRDFFRKLNYESLFILLDADYQTVLSRLQKRKEHFASQHLLKSQFDALQWPENEADCLVIDNNLPRKLAEQSVFDAILQHTKR